MIFKKEKYLSYSIIVVILGWVYFFSIDYLNYLEFNKQFDRYQSLLIQFPDRGKYDIFWLKLVAIGFGLISFYFGYGSKLSKHKNLRTSVIIVSLLLIILSIVLFPHLISKIFC